MILPDKWGQGALFAYSAAKGTQKKDSAFDARLCADGFALEFCTKNKCTLSIACEDATDISFSAVMTDYIRACLRCGSGEYIVDIIFQAENTVMIKSDYAITVDLKFAHAVSAKKAKKTMVYTSDGETFALGEKKADGFIVYAFAYGKNAAEICDAALQTDFDKEADKKFSSYETLPEMRIPADSIEKLYYRCVSILMGCVNSGEGIIKSRYITPAKGAMNRASSFWSAICTLGLRHFAPDIARETLESILASQAGDGMIPAWFTPEEKSSDLNPPVLAWCFWELYQTNGDKDMLSDAYASLKKYIHYITETRDINKNQLFEWQIGDSPEDFGKESTMDNSPRFDDGIILDCVDFSSYVANEAYHMSLIAEEIDRHGEGLYWNVMFERIRNAVNDMLFDEDDKIYYDRAVVSNMLKKVKTSASFLPLFAGICDNRHAMALLRLLNSEERFNCKYGIPSVSVDSEEYDCDMWRGPVHICLNYFISKGLDKYQMHDKANEIKAKTLDIVLREYENNGVLYEFYSPDGERQAKNLPRKGYGTSDFMFASDNVNIRDFAPTAAVIVDMLFSKSKKIPVK